VDGYLAADGICLGIVSCSVRDVETERTARIIGGKVTEVPCLVKSPVKACVVQKIGSTGSVQTINHVIVKRKRLPVIFHGENFIGDRESYFDLGDAFRQSVKDLRQLGGIITVC